MKSFINFIDVICFFISIAFKHVFFKNFFFRFFDTRFYHRIFLKIDVIIERFKHFRQNVIKSIKRQSLNIFDNNDDNIYNDDIYNDDNKNVKCVKNSIKIFEKFQ